MEIRYFQSVLNSTSGSWISGWLFLGGSLSIEILILKKYYQTFQKYISFKLKLIILTRKMIQISLDLVKINWQTYSWNNPNFF